jgi:hypothetical protein
VGLLASGYAGRQVAEIIYRRFVMALQECPDCQKMVSTTAKVCPQCGSKKLAVYVGEKPIQNKHTLASCLLTILFLILAGVSFGWIGLFIAMIFACAIDWFLIRTFANLW